MSVLTTSTRMWLTRSLKPFLFTNEYDNQLEYKNTKNMGLYIHIPFCRTLCEFCPYCKVIYDEKIADAYVDALIEEIHLVAHQDKERKKVTSLYFGGGSPALVSSRIKEIISVLKQYFDIAEGIGIELHPEDVSVNQLEILKEAGITKISIGIQSFQDDFLQVLGRKKIDFSMMFHAIHQVSFETVSMDLIFALPGQTFEGIRKDIEMAFQNGANHIAIYPFIDFTFTQSQIRKMRKTEKRKLLDDITEYCMERGYVRDSIWTFGRPQTKKYSSMTRDNFLGFGCSATTLLEDQFKINTFSIKEYIKRIQKKQLPTSLTVRFTMRQRMIYYLFWTAYTTRIDSLAFEKFFGMKLEKQYGFELWIARVFGFVKKSEFGYEMTQKGAYYYHYYENYYTLSYIDQMWSLMNREAFPKEIKF